MIFGEVGDGIADALDRTSRIRDLIEQECRPDDVEDVEAEGGGPPQRDTQHAGGRGKDGSGQHQRCRQRHQPGPDPGPAQDQQPDKQRNQRQRGRPYSPPLSRHGRALPKPSLSYEGIASAGDPGDRRRLFMIALMTGRKKSTAASRSSARDTGLVKRIPRLPWDMIRLRRRAASVSSPRTMATTRGASGSSSFLNRKPMS